MGLYVGTSGWAFKEWKGGFYPRTLPQARFLEHYARELGACEVNATFYRLQSAETFAKWREATPAGFRFAVKGHRRLTHWKRLEVSERWRSFAAEFFASLAPLGEHLGCVLLQFPPYLERDDTALEALLSILRDGPPLAIELRHESWQGDDVGGRVAERGATLCLADEGGPVPEELPPGPLAYVRMRAERYSEAEREGWIELLRREATSRDVYAFTKHEQGPADDPFTGVGFAQWLAERSAS
jgi:uncharacterized protein YecE (DUF72 family)